MKKSLSIRFYTHLAHYGHTITNQIINESKAGAETKDSKRCLYAHVHKSITVIKGWKQFVTGEWIKKM